jgi:hypothetical protein
MMHRGTVLLALALTSLSAEGQEPTQRKLDPVGSRLPEWRNLVSWINAPHVSEQPTRALLLRFIAPSCPLCLASLSALGNLHRQYSDRGLRVVVIYTPKPSGQRPDVAEIERMVGTHAGARFRLPLTGIGRP